jgi:hypothetical protein
LNPKIGALFDGPLDVIGDIHGEIDALRNILPHLGYNQQGIHPGGRRLVFVGDLTDRGPDSPAVAEFVLSLVNRRLAQCVLGNHELNLLRVERKQRNGWFFQPDHDAAKGRFAKAAHLPAERRQWLLSQLEHLPIALERPDLRVVHAAWHSHSIEQIRSSPLGTLELYRFYEEAADWEVSQSGLRNSANQEMETHKDLMENAAASMPILSHVAKLDELEQMGNPLKVVSSGIERATSKPFFATGKWRMTDRIAWWNDYHDAVPVIVGHYWRWPTPRALEAHTGGEPDLFAGCKPHHWFGARRNVYCVDFAVGARHLERREGEPKEFQCRLGAVRWPEQELVFDDGRTIRLE